MKTTIIVLVSLLGAISMARADDQDVTARNLAVVRAQTDSLNRGDLDAAIADFAEDVSNFGKSRGHSGMRSVFEDIWRTFPDMHFEILDLSARAIQSWCATKSQLPIMEWEHCQVWAACWWACPPRTSASRWNTFTGTSFGTERLWITTQFAMISE